YATAVAFSPDSTRLAICGGRVSFYDPLTGKEEVRLADGFAGPALGSGVAFAADGRHVAAANGRKVALWNIQNHRPALAFEIEAAAGNDKQFQVVAFSPTGKMLATAGASRACLFPIDADRDTHGKARELEGGFGTTLSHALAFSADGSRLATGHVANRVLIWDVRAGALVTEVGEASKEITHTVNGLAFFPDGKTLAAAGVGCGYTPRHEEIGRAHV